MHSSTVRQAVDTGELEVVRLRRTAKGWRVTPEALDRFIAARSEPCQSEKPKTVAISSRSIAAVRGELDGLLGPSSRRQQLERELLKAPGARPEA